MSSTEPMVKFRTSDGETKEAGWAVFRQFGLFAPQDATFSVIQPATRPSIVFDVPWAKIHLANIPARQNTDATIFSEELLQQTLALNPVIQELRITRPARWIRKPDSISGMRTSAVLTFEDPDGTLERALLKTPLFAFGAVVNAKKWHNNPPNPELRPRDEIPLANVSSAVLDKVIEYCEHHKNDPPTQPDSSIYSGVPKLDEWDQKFVQMENELLLNVIMAGNYLDIKPLLNAACKGFGESIKGKTPMQIGSMLGAVSDFTPEEEAQIRKAEEGVKEWLADSIDTLRLAVIIMRKRRPYPHKDLPSRALCS